MNAADAAGSKHLDARALRDPAGGRHRCCPVPFLRDGYWQIANADLSDPIASGDATDLFVTKSGAELAFDYGDRCRHSTSFANDLFQTASGFEILRLRQTVSNHGRLKRDERLVFFQGCGDFSVKVDKRTVHDKLIQNEPAGASRPSRPRDFRSH